MLNDESINVVYWILNAFILKISDFKNLNLIIKNVQLYF